MRKNLPLFAWGILIYSSALFAGVSAVRLPGEKFEQARDRNLPLPWDAADQTAYEAAVAWKDLDTSSLPVQKDYKKVFELIRDTRFLTDSSNPEFPRRSSWLYPQDGCFARASVARRFSKGQGYADFKKAFIFGNLHVTTKNAPEGSVDWWYHVVPIFQDEKGNALVVDPAMDPTGALPFEDWALKMVSATSDATFSICSPSTYDPGSLCEEIDPDSDRYAESDQEMYLSFEWSNLLTLGRNPETELGDSPPWLPLLAIK